MERYDDDEVAEILRRAAEQREGLEHDDLVEAAKEAGIDPRAVERAAEAVRADREMHDERRDELATSPSPLAVARFKRHLLTFAVVNVFLFLIDVLTPGAWWFFWPLLSWGVFVALQGVGLLVPTPEKTKPKSRRERRREAAETKERERHARRQAKRDATKARLANAEAAFEGAVERGLASVLEQVTGGLESLAPKPKERKGAFGEFVSRQEGDDRSRTTGTDRVRVDPSEEEAEPEPTAEPAARASHSREREA